MQGHSLSLREGGGGGHKKTICRNPDLKTEGQFVTCLTVHGNTDLAWVFREGNRRTVCGNPHLAAAYPH